MNSLAGSFFKHYVFPIKYKYADFKERTSRKSFWLFILYDFIISGIFFLIDNAMRISILSTLYSLLILIPSLAIIFRRLHDIGKSGVWILIQLVPIIGQICFFILLCLKSEEYDNKYGTYIKD